MPDSQRLQPAKETTDEAPRRGRTPSINAELIEKAVRKVGRSGEVTMALGHMGRSGGNIAVQITDKLVREGEIP